MTSDIKKYDIVIIGAGMVGLSLTKLLMDLPLSIAVVEAHEIPEWKPDGYGLRVSALSPASQSVLKQADVWDAISAERISPYTGMCIWEQDPDSSEALHFTAQDSEVESLGCIVENDLIRMSLKKSIDDQSIQNIAGKAKVSFYLPDRLESASLTEPCARIFLESGIQLEAKLLIAADGANSITRRKLKLPEVSRSYEQCGVVAELKTEFPHGKIAYQRFNNSEVLGILPLANGHCSMVWSCSQSRADSLLKLSNEELGRALSEFSQQVLGDITLVDDAKAFPLQLLHSRQYVAERLVLCGDAAHAVHPLAGQGVNLGLLDAVVLNDVISQGWKDNYDLGDLSLLRQYERKRKANNVQMMTGLDALLGLFQSNNPFLQQARRVGMGLVNKTTPLKSILVDQALGLKSL